MLYKQKLICFDVDGLRRIFGTPNHMYYIGIVLSSGFDPNLIKLYYLSIIDEI